MNFHIKVEMLVTVAVLYLAFGTSDGRVLSKCELGQDLNSTLPANLLAKIPNLVAKIVCYAGLSSQFNTSTITYVSSVPGSNGGQKCRPAEGSSSEEESTETIQVPNTGFSGSTVKPVSSSQDNNPSSKDLKRRKVRSAKSSSEESSEENTHGPKHRLKSSTVKPVTQSLSSNVTSSNGSYVKARKRRSAESSSEESTGNDSGSSSSEERRKRSVSESSSEESTGNDSGSSSSEERRKRSVSESSSEESSEENIRGSKSTVKPVTKYQGNNVTSKYFKGRRQRSAELSSEESSGDDSSSSSSEERKKRSASESNSEESSEETIQGPKHGYNSSAVMPITKSQDNNMTKGKYLRGRRYRSVESSSEEFSGDDSDSSSSEERKRRSASKASSEESSEEKHPLNSFNSSMATPVTHPPVNNSVSGKAARQRPGRSAESNTKECNKKNMWTLYGLFQLPDRIACTSGVGPSLNLCNLPCSSLLDDNITDDISCFEIVLNKILSEEKQIGPNKELFRKLRADFFKKECENETDSSFSTC